MANTFLTISKITNESLMVLENMLGFTGKVNRQYDDQFAVAGAKIGDTLNVRKPVRYTVSTGQALDLQDVKSTSVPVKLDTQNHVDFQFSSADLALNIDLFRERYIAPAVAALANQIDYNGLRLYREVWNHVGAPGTVPSALLTYLQATAKLNHNAVPKDGMRYCAIDPMMEVTLTNSLLAYFNPTRDLSDSYRTGEMGTAAGLQFFMDQNISTHTVGTVTGATPVTHTATAIVSGTASIVTDGWAPSTLNRGDIVSVAGLYAVNPQSRQSTGQLMQFTVTQDMASATAITIPVSPTPILSGPEQNCIYGSAGATTVGDGIAIYVFDTTTMANVNAKATPQGLAYHRDAFCLACADLPLPGGTDMAARASDKQLGLSIRLVRQYDISTDQWPCRLDILYGWAALRPELACRVSA